ERDCGPETDTGACEFGTQTCDENGKWKKCENATYSSDETCNQIDDNCDGIQDNVNNGTSVEETQCQCYAGGTPKQTETCDAIDDDCNEIIDDDWNADGDGYVKYADECNDSYEEFDCDDNDPNINPSADELCTGDVDEDCDGDAYNGCDKNASVFDETIPSTPTCGDGMCEVTESTATCCTDCGCDQGLVCIGNECVPGDASTAVCGDGICDSAEGETSETCPSDCKEKSNIVLYSSILAIILLSAGFAGWWFFYKRPESELEDLTETHGVSEPSARPTRAVTQSVDSYITNCLSLGYSPKQIKQALITKGWDEEKVNDLLAQSHGDLTELGELAEKHKVSTVGERKAKRVKKYISAGLKKGFSATEIKTKLLDAGWPKQIVEEAFAKQPTLSRDISKLAKKHKIDTGRKTKTKASKFVKESLNKGHTTNEVRKALKDAGWKSEKINEHLPK
ncbi:hypothetical protein GF374_02325, partial [Candidatus Woesearchaeota archaeon]|nr:hypothetical protein [Candidatus Woesearchaeota archaeon]